eukprot:gene7907-1119_t
MAGRKKSASQGARAKLTDRDMISAREFCIGQGVEGILLSRSAPYAFGRAFGLCTFHFDTARLLTKPGNIGQEWGQQG